MSFEDVIDGGIGDGFPAVEEEADGGGSSEVVRCGVEWCRLGWRLHVLHAAQWHFQKAVRVVIQIDRRLAIECFVIVEPPTEARPNERQVH